ncbi:hypothetical protein WJX81_000023 [Elliptochloris bilobata]|uniref:Peptidase M50 domain-containing protein n=1 Tax=Elliptochloris bilobata TaxID=381761 RepID=A0AAW1RLR2_9CHLO
MAGIPVRLHYLFFVTLLLPMFFQAWVSWIGVLWAFVIFGPVLFVTILLHELGHCLATRQVGGDVHGILLWPLGGLAFVGHAGSPARDLYVAVCGPLTHIPQFAAWYLMLVLSRRGITGAWSPSLAMLDASQQFWLAVCVGACQVNLALMAFNLLLPAYPLDGGRIFADLMLLCGVPALLAAKVTVGVAITIGIAIIAFGAIYFNVITMIVGVWMLISTFELFQAIRTDTIKQHPMFYFEPAAAQNDPMVMLPANHPRSAGV